MSNRDTSDYTHGDQGAWPPSGTNFQNGDTLNAQPVDKLFWYLTEKSRDFANEFDRLDSDNDGVVDEADYAYDANATLYKGNDIDSNGDGTVDAAEFATNANDADTVDGQHWSDIKDWVNNNIDTENSSYADNADAVDNQDWADIKNWVNTQSDVPNADYADDADSVDGKDWVDIQTWVNNNADVPNADYADSADTVDGYDIQKNGNDGSGVINFKT